ncbi:uncharacterized protein B0I36DRAFT_349092 [Microdochium trichocladiopsis]|uniref:Uncharacterized protein n=1 Tax=Microdochium trichocladiopsis TaxID=1682393 RepID=A0A9P8Y8W0_9PEZI|nr:uncharacterized protein B0I36DRAFT_349092 [Microdochium trichocladiopsis]KAH7030929.1 hypothetical protein B0I36DRAFT_349092 [Microdochium trichocladiopsis]
MVEQYYVADRAAESNFSHVASADQDMQRGRKRRRSPPDLQREDTHLVSEESATFRGRCRHRSTSRLDLSRASSRFRGGSLSPSRKKLLYIANMHRRRDQSPSRSRSPAATDASKRRRQRTRSHSRDHPHKSAQFTATEAYTSGLRHELLRDDVIRPVENAIIGVQQTG